MLNPLEAWPTGRIFDSLAAARSAAGTLEAGDQVVIRDMRTIAPAAVWSTTKEAGKWWARPYMMGDGPEGHLLMVNERAVDAPAQLVPPEFELTLDLPGWYAIWVGVPRLDLRPRLSWGLDGVDVALDGEPGFMHLCAEQGARRGAAIGPAGVEVTCFWKVVRLDGRTLRVRIPYGTYAAHPWGLARGSISSLRLAHLSDAQADEYLRDLTSSSNKPVIMVHDGFSHYFSGGEPGTGIDARFVQAYRDTDVKKLFFQTGATGIATWPSQVTSLPGELVSEAGWKTLRRGDRRVYDYLRWAVANQQEGFRVISGLCQEAGLECHASIRLNSFFAPGIFGAAIGDFLNGRWWQTHPEARLPGRTSIDYAHPAARRYLLDLVTELATLYPFHGLNLDFTRWPPIADPQTHTSEVLTSLMVDVRQTLDAVARTTGRRMELSAIVVEGYHAYMTLPEQRIDLEACLRQGLLNFVCGQTWDHRDLLTATHNYGVPYFATFDQDPMDVPAGWRADPNWRQPDRQDEDPMPGEELEEEPHVNSILDPREFDQGVLRAYDSGADGACLINKFFGWRSSGRLGPVDEMRQRVRMGQVYGQAVWPHGLTLT
jgi:hypothetical protein